jgi:hypothetical protein
MYKRKQVDVLIKRLKEPRRFLQVLWGRGRLAKDPVQRKLLVGACGIPLKEFLLTPPSIWMENCFRCRRSRVEDYSRLRCGGYFP